VIPGCLPHVYVGYTFVCVWLRSVPGWDYAVVTVVTLVAVATHVALRCRVVRCGYVVVADLLVTFTFVTFGYVYVYVDLYVCVAVVVGCYGCYPFTDVWLPVVVGWVVTLRLHVWLLRFAFVGCVAVVTVTTFPVCVGYVCYVTLVTVTLRLVCVCLRLRCTFTTFTFVTRLRC